MVDLQIPPDSLVVLELISLLAKELGPDLAKEFLDAHESGRETDPNAAMDLANNRAGLLAAERLPKAGKLTQEEIKKDAMIAINDKTLVVLKPQRGPK